MPSRSSPVRTWSAGIPSEPQTDAATTALSPVTIFTRRPSWARRRTEAAADAFGGSRNTRNPFRVSPCSSDAPTFSRPPASRLATAITRTPRSNCACSKSRVASVTPSQRPSTDSGAPFVINDRTPPSSTRAVVLRRSWSNGMRSSTRMSPSGAPWASRSASSSGPPPPPAPDTVASVQRSPSLVTRSGSAPLVSIARSKVIRPSVSVPVLSENRTSMSPRSSMLTSRFTRTLCAANRCAPVARGSSTRPPAAAAA